MTGTDDGWSHIFVCSMYPKTASYRIRGNLIPEGATMIDQRGCSCGVTHTFVDGKQQDPCADGHLTRCKTCRSIGHPDERCLHLPAAVPS